MSADRDFIDDRPDERIPDDAPLRDVVPDDFVARSSAATLREALLEAEAATSRSEAELPRCPGCHSIHIERKTVGQATTHETDYRCTTCSAQFDQPAPSVEDSRKGEQVTLPGVRER